MLKGINQGSDYNSKFKGISPKDVHRIPERERILLSQELMSVTFDGTIVDAPDIVKGVHSDIHLKEEPVKIEENYAALSEKPKSKTLESYSLEDDSSGEKYKLKASVHGTLAMIPEEEFQSGTQTLSIAMRGGGEEKKDKPFSGHFGFEIDPKEYGFLSSNFIR